jgi:hypothetical protein
MNEVEVNIGLLCALVGTLLLWRRAIGFSGRNFAARKEVLAPVAIPVAPQRMAATVTRERTGARWEPREVPTFLKKADMTGIGRRSVWPKTG